MDVARTCFIQKVRPWSDSNETIYIRWYVAKPGAKIFDGTTCFGSPVWDNMEGGYNPVTGVLAGPEKPIYNRGSNVFRPPGLHYHGTPSDFFRGNLYATRVPFDGNPPGMCMGDDKLGWTGIGKSLEAVVEKIGTRYGMIELRPETKGQEQHVTAIYGTVTIGKELAGFITTEDDRYGQIELGKSLAGEKEGIEEISGSDDPGLSLRGVLAHEQSLSGQTTVGKALTGVVAYQQSILGGVEIDKLSAGIVELDEMNRTINGGFEFFQRQSAAVATRRANNTFTADRWLLLTNDTGTSDPSGSSAQKSQRTTGDTSSLYALGIAQTGASAKKQGICQWLEASDVYPLRSQPMVFSMRCYLTTAANMRMAIIEWNGSADTLGSARDPINNWANSADSNPTTTFLKSASIAAIHYSTAVTVGAAFTQLSIGATIQANTNNIALLCWCESSIANGDSITYSQGGFVPGYSVPPWRPLPVALELAACQRYFEKTYDLGDGPGTVIGNGSWNDRSKPTGEIYQVPEFRVTKRATPTIHSYSPATGAIDKFRNNTTSADVTAAYYNIGQQAFLLYAAGITAGQDCSGHWTAESEL